MSDQSFTGQKSMVKAILNQQQVTVFPFGLLGLMGGTSGLAGLANSHEYKPHRPLVSKNDIGRDIEWRANAARAPYQNLKLSTDKAVTGAWVEKIRKMVGRAA